MNESYKDKPERWSKGEGDSDMRRTGEGWESLQSLLRDTAEADAASGVRPFVADRVMRRLAAERAGPQAQGQEDLWQWLVVVFRPVAGACLLLVAALAAHNLYLSSQFEADRSVVEAVLALPEVNTAVALDLEVSTLEEPDQQ